MVLTESGTSQDFDFEDDDDDEEDDVTIGKYEVKYLDMVITIIYARYSDFKSCKYFCYKLQILMHEYNVCRCQ